MDVWCCLQQLKIFKNNTVKPYGSLKGMRRLRYCRLIFLKLLCKTLLETFAKKPFPRQPKPKHRFSAVSLPQYLLILPKCPLNPPRIPDIRHPGRLLGGNRHT